MSTPLDKQSVTLENETTGKKETIPALHPKWVERVQFVSYQPPPLDISDHGQYEEWLERIRFIEDDLHWLLQLPHDKFWCQAVFDETLHNLLDTYLRHAPRSYDVLFDLPDDGKQRHSDVHRLVFFTCLRMATFKETKANHITPEVFGEILYENFLFDIPKLMDICVLYNHGNGPLLSKMIENVFANQPKYTDDLKVSIPTILQVFDGVKKKCGLDRDILDMSPEKLSSPRRNNQALVTMAIGEFQDIVFYLSDIGATLVSFLDVYPTACSVFKEEDFLYKLAVFYDAMIPEVALALKTRDFDNASLRPLLKQKLHQAKKCLAKSFHLIVQHCCIRPMLEKSGSLEEHVEDFLETMSSVLNERRFLADYESLYSFQEDMDILLQSGCDIDETRIQYIQDAVNHSFATYGKRKKPKGATTRGGRTSPEGSPGPLDEGGAVGGASGGSVDAMGDFQVDAYSLEGATARQVTGVELESLISSVKDLLPDLGEGFIELCLEEFDYDIERVINSMLEEKLPPSLHDLDRCLKRDTAKKSASSEHGEGAVPPDTLLSERRNVFDYDEFDVFHRDNIDTSKIRTGKVGKTDQLDMDDKRDMQSVKSQLIERYDVIVDDPEEALANQMYDDEYDDTYDTNLVGADDADSADELTARRPFTVPRILSGGVPREDNAKGWDSESEDSDETARRKRDEFVADPAKLREQAAARAQSRGQRRGHGRVPFQAPRTYDVKGAAKGQGQSDEVLRNRRFKEQHKGRVGSQNKRELADRKRRV